MCVGVGTPAAIATVDPLVTVSGPSPFARGCGDRPLRDIASRNAEVEPSVAVNPTNPANLIAAWQQDRRPDGGARGIMVAASQDGGRTWSTPVAPPLTRCSGGSTANGGAYRSASDPWVSFGADGIAYLMALTVDGRRAANAMTVVTSGDGGVTWNPPVALIIDDGGVFNDKNSVTGDPARPGVAYAVWARSGRGGQRTFFTRTADGGRTWEIPHTILVESPGYLPLGHQIVVLPDGSLLLAYGRYGRHATTLAIATSRDGGATWSIPRRVVRLPPLDGFVVDPFDGARVRTGDGVLPELAVDGRTGSVYMVWQATRAVGRTAVLISRSDDAGSTWSTPKVVNDVLRTQAFTPMVAVNADGTIAVTYYDLSDDSAKTRPLWTRAWVGRSFDGGQTFMSREALTPERFDLRRAPSVAGGYFLGDYQGLVGTGSTFTAVFARGTGTAGDRTAIVATTIR